MGSILNTRLKEQLSKDISLINPITSNNIFYLKTGVSLLFTNAIGEGFFSSIFSSNVIEVHMSDQSAQEPRVFYITLSRFYLFYHTLMNSLPIFYEQTILKQNENKKINYEEELCCICDENKTNIMLECYHCFCQSCIDTWLFSKISNCPVCRVKVAMWNKNAEKSPYWDVIEVKDIDQKEYIEEMKERFYFSLDSLKGTAAV